MTEYTIHNVSRDSYTNFQLFLSLMEQTEKTNALIAKVDSLMSRILYLENTFLPIPDEHEIFYEKVYQSNPLLGYQEPPNPTFIKSPDSSVSSVFKVAGN